MSKIPPRFLQLSQKFCRIRCTNIRLFKKSKGNTESQQDDERMSPSRIQSGVPKFKIIKRACLFDKVVVIAIQQSHKYLEMMFEICIDGTTTV